MSTNSSTGGYLLPSPLAPILPGALSFRQFLQTVFVGISGLSGDLVRPKWQVSPPKNPDIFVNWMAIALVKNRPDAYAYNAPGLGSQASGSILFKDRNPAPADTVTVNSVVITFVAASPTGDQVLIGATPADTARNLQIFLANSSNVNLITAIYTFFSQAVMVTAAFIGTAGNSFTLSSLSTAVQVSGDTLIGGSAINNNILQRHEDLEIQCSFYGPSSEDLASLVRDGFQIQQNLEALRSANMGFVGTNEVMHVPDLLNERWVDRYEMSVFLRREIIRSYPILSFASVSGTIESVVGENLKTIAWGTNT